MEENIKILEELQKELSLYADGKKIRQGIALEHLLKAYKELEYKYNRALSDLVQESHKNKKLKEEKGWLLEEVNYLNEEKWKDFEFFVNILSKTILTSKIKEKIEELETKMEYENNKKVLIWLHKQRSVLQELLEKR